MHEKDIMRMCDENHFTLEFLTSQCGRKENGVVIEIVEAEEEREEEGGKQKGSKALVRGQGILAAEGVLQKPVVGYRVGSKNRPHLPHSSSATAALDSEDSDEEVIAVTVPTEKKTKKRKAPPTGLGVGSEEGHGIPLFVIDRGSGIRADENTPVLDKDAAVESASVEIGGEATSPAAPLRLKKKKTLLKVVDQEENDSKKKKKKEKEEGSVAGVVPIAAARSEEVGGGAVIVKKKKRKQGENYQKEE